MQLETFKSWFSGPTVALPETAPDRSAAAAIGLIQDRRYLRSPVNSKASVCWEGARVGKRQVECKAANTSIAGAMVISPEPIPIGEPVYIYFKDLRLVGNAAVRHCTQRKSKFLIGLEYRGSLIRSF
ncbi:MAG TPA: PilZ domain-containing protein [Bryobacteraceae bacterium]|nr:PilZ domain-containing protein [Bryobacteraceae bacterium]